METDARKRQGSDGDNVEAKWIEPIWARSGNYNYDLWRYRIFFISVVLQFWLNL